MNYYEKHIGDYLRDAGHLSLLEHGVYNRLLDVYYTREGPIPIDQAARLIGARSDDEREALASVLQEFFHQTDAGWTHTRCDAEVARYRDKTDKARKSAEARWGKTPHPPQEPTALPSDNTGNATAMPTHSEGTASAMRTHSEGNAHQSPDTSNQKEQELRALAEKVGPPSPQGDTCNRLRLLGMPHVNSMHPDLLAVLADGATAESIAEAATELKSRKPDCFTFSYLLKMVRGRLDSARSGKHSRAANAFARTDEQRYERGALTEGRLPSWLEGTENATAAV